MGHCAPAVMQTLVGASDASSWLVLLTAGLPGGIGNTGGECGGLTASLLMLGLRYPRDETRDGLPVVMDRGHALLEGFVDANTTTQCRDIRGGSRLPIRCIGVVGTATQRAAEHADRTEVPTIPGEAREAFAAVYAHWTEHGFHCADNVLSDVTPGLAVPPKDLRDAVTAFMGGTVMCGMTCSALTAGVMALGVSLGEIEHSKPRVLRMLATMAVGRDAFAEDLNAFNRIMNLGHDLAAWFVERFGSNQCRALTGIDFAKPDEAAAYIDTNQIVGCAQIAASVAARVSKIIDETMKQKGML